MGNPCSFPCTDEWGMWAFIRTAGYNSHACGGFPHYIGALAHTTRTPGLLPCIACFSPSFSLAIIPILWIAAPARGWKCSLLYLHLGTQICLPTGRCIVQFTPTLHSYMTHRMMIQYLSRTTLMWWTTFWIIPHLSLDVGPLWDV